MLPQYSRLLFVSNEMEIKSEFGPCKERGLGHPDQVASIEIRLKQDNMCKTLDSQQQSLFLFLPLVSPFCSQHLSQILEASSSLGLC